MTLVEFGENKLIYSTFWGQIGVGLKGQDWRCCSGCK
jgi:hypothetical protein